MLELRDILPENFYDQEHKSKKNGGCQVNTEVFKVVHFERSPGHDHGYTGSDEDHGVDSSNQHINFLRLDWPCSRAYAEQNVRGEQCTEEHHLRSEEQPYAQLGTGKTGILTNVNGVGNFHRVLFFRFYRFFRLVLWGKLFYPAIHGNIILISRAVDLRYCRKISMSDRG